MPPVNRVFFQRHKYLFILFILFISGSLYFKNHPYYRIWNAPDATLITIRGEKIRLQALRGKPVLITFWATDCPSCIKEVNDFIDLYQQFHHQGLEIIAIAMVYDPPSHVVAMTKMKHIPYPVVLDLRGELAQVFKQVTLTPTTFLINPQGQIILQKIGLFNLKDMKTTLQQFF